MIRREPPPGREAQRGVPGGRPAGPAQYGRTGTPRGTGGCRCRSRCRCRSAARRSGRGPRAPRCSWPAKMGLDPAMVVHAKGMGPDFTFFIVYGRVGHLVDLSAVTVAEREFPVLPAAGGEPADPFGAGPQARRGGRLHRHRRAHRRHRRDPQRQGARGGEGTGVLPGDPGGEHGRPGGRAGPGGPGPGRAGRRGAGQPGGDPAGRAPVERAGDGRRVPGRLPVRRAAAAGGGRPAVRPGRRDGARRGQDLRPRHDAARGGQLPGVHAGPGAAQPARRAWPARPAPGMRRPWRRWERSGRPPGPDLRTHGWGCR